MKGWLTVNGFMRNAKFDDIYALLVSAAARQGIDLQLKYSDQIAADMYLRKDRDPSADFVLFYDKDTYLAREMELRGMPVFNSSGAIALCDSKALTYLCLQTHAIPTVESILSPITYEHVGYPSFDFVKEAGNRLGYPFVIKEEYGSMGMQVYMAHDEAEAIHIVQTLSNKRFLMQKYIAGTNGSDYRIHVADGNISASIRRYSTDGDFRSNVSLGGSTQAFIPDSSMARLAVSAADAMGLLFAGVDIMMDGDTPIVTEVNSNPHFRSALDATGIDFADAIMDAILKRMHA